ncbi:outer membrane beta-barrel protein [Pontibacter ruber]|uniref:Outer membrane beta-barrel protein n=1 Tax=Pontibacter ruber TaxID=1343895 RepID=A0ABW5CUA2_9BACT|nr:outer membrane beta-barrel protein [Pontibacter ruber]
MKRLLLLVTAIIMAAATGVSAKGGPTVAERFGKQDTIVVKMANGAKMVLYLENMQQLQAFQNYSLDSLMRVLNKYAQQVEKMENTGELKSNEMTVTMSPSATGDTTKTEKITITVQETTKDGKTTKERHEVRINKNFKIDVEIEEDGENTKVDVNVPDKAERNSTRAANEEKHYKATKFNFDVDLGLNNFVNADDNEVPDLKTTGSKYVSLNMHLNSQIGGRKSPFYLTSGFEFAFNNYMFDDNIRVQDINGVTSFVEETELNYEKSKLTHSSVNIPLMAVLKYKRENGKDGFKIGAGGFGGYRLGSHTKLKYELDGNTEKDKTKDNFNLSDFQYGLEGVIGYGGLDLFVKYNMNDLFKDNRGPKVNVISFGLRLLN